MLETKEEKLNSRRIILLHIKCSANIAGTFHFIRCNYNSFGIMHPSASAMGSRILHEFGRRRLLSSVDESTVFGSCSQQYPDGNTTAILGCISDMLESRSDGFSEDEVHFLLMICGSLIFFMQAGFAMLCAGCVQLKNVQNTMMKNLLDACGSAIAFFIIGKDYTHVVEDRYGSIPTFVMANTQIDLFCAV
jgi:Ammonium Transporter Family